MLCDMQCRLTAAHREVDRGRLEAALSLLGEIENILQRAIACGAMVDPWNILGFGGQFSLFPAPENSIHDERVDELINLMSEIFALYIRIGKEAAALGNAEVQAALNQRLKLVTEWWDKFATTEVSEVGGISGHDTFVSAGQVAAALQAWHEAGAAAGDVAFWRRHVEHFRSAKSYALVVDTLLDHGDLVAAMALLVHWLSQSDSIPLVEENYSFNDLAISWMEDLWQAESADGARQSKPLLSPRQRWSSARKFLDYLEANAGEYWQAPQLEVFSGRAAEGRAEEETEPGEEADNLYSAAYEQFTYRDSTNDGIDSSLFETPPPASEFELVLEAERIVGHLAFLATVAHLWKTTAAASFYSDTPLSERDEVLAGWRRQSMVNYGQLMELLSAVHAYRIPPPRGTYESLLEYDRRRGVKEMLLENIINACVETAGAARLISAVMSEPVELAQAEDWEEPMQQALRAVVRGDAAKIRGVWKKLLGALGRQPLLYVALARGGNPLRIVAAQPASDVMPLAGLSASTGPAGGNRATSGNRPRHGVRASPRAGRDHRIRSPFRDRLQGHCPLPGGFRGGLVARGRSGPATCCRQ